MTDERKEVPSEMILLAEFDEWWISEGANGLSNACRFSAWNAWIAKDKQFRAEHDAALAQAMRMGLELTELRADLAQRAQAEPVAWLLPESSVNHIQVASIQKLVARAKHAHYTNVTLRINGQDEHYQADWIKHLQRTRQPTSGHDRLAQCVDRFLNWPLPKTFSPDCGISFSRTLIGPDKVPGSWPVGTNLFTADEARQMLEYVLAAAPESEGEP